MFRILKALSRTSSVALLLLLASLFVAFPDNSNAQSVSIVINEVELDTPANDTNSTDGVSEQVELYNPTTDPINVTNWTVSSTHGDTVTLTINATTIIPPGGFLLVGQDGQWLDDDNETAILKDSTGVQIDSAGPFSDGPNGELNDSTTWQLCFDEPIPWVFREGTLGQANDCIIQPPVDTITVVKETQPENSTELFNFTGDLGNFTLAGGQNITFTGLDPASYNITEIVPDGWFHFGQSCSTNDPANNNCNFDVDAATIQANLGSDGSLIVTFQNEDLRGNLFVTKETEPDGSPQSFNFTGDLGNFTLSDGQHVAFLGLAPGIYNITEIVPVGWFHDGQDCNFNDNNDFSDCNNDTTSATVQVILGSGGNGTVEFHNEDIRGNITIFKETEPDGSTQLFNFTGDLGNFTLGDGQSVTFTVPPGSYNVTEIVPVGSSLDFQSCDLDNESGCFTNVTSATVEVILVPGGFATVGFHNKDLRGNITVAKQTEPGGSTQVFNFTGELGNFTLSDGQSVTFAGLAPGSYNVTEIVPDGWFNSGKSCVASDPGSGCDLLDPGIPTVRVDLADNGNITVTFDNEDIRGNITIIKETAPDGSTQVFNFTGDLGNFTLGDGQNATFTVPSGNYGVTEMIPPGWVPDPILDCVETPPFGSEVLFGPNNVTISLVPDENVICTFTNEEISGNGDQLGTITIIKQTDPDGSTQVFNFTGDLGNFTLSDGQNVTFTLPEGTYNVDETDLPDGWIFKLTSCTPGSSSLPIHLAANGTVVCTFFNEQILSNVTIIKQTDPDGSTQVFNFTGDLGNFTLSDGQSVTFTGLESRNHNITELVPPGWNFEVDCVATGGGFILFKIPNTISITPEFASANIICTVTNEADRGTIIVEKQTIPDGAPGSFTFTGDVAGTISDNGQLIVSNLLPGNYSTTEVDPAPFTLTNIACNDTNSFWNVAGRNATFVLEPGEVVKCTFTNSEIIEVDIDIKPGSDPNPLNLKKDRTITVAILGSSTFNVDSIDVSPLSDAPKFGGTTPKAPIRTSYKDVNNDGFVDLVLQYRLAGSGFTASSTEGCISGKLTNGITIEGCDSVKIVPK